MKWKVLDSEYLHKESWLTIRKEKCELPNGKIMPAYYIIEYPEWVSILALTKDNKAVFVKQYRHGLGVESLELPGGVVDPGETHDVAAKRELKEETGYVFESYEYLGKISPNPATSTNFMHMYLARGGEKVAEQSLDETEDVEVVYFTLDEVKRLLSEHKILQSLHVTTLFYALNKLGLVAY